MAETKERKQLGSRLVELLLQSQESPPQLLAELILFVVKPLSGGHLVTCCQKHPNAELLYFLLLG